MASMCLLCTPKAAANLARCEPSPFHSDTRLKVLYSTDRVLAAKIISLQSATALKVSLPGISLDTSDMLQSTEKMYPGLYLAQ